jgi:copper transporter 1
MMTPPAVANGTFCAGMGRVMGPGFWLSPGGACVLFLFSSWTLDTAAKYALGLVGAFLMGSSNEGLSWLRRRLVNKFAGTSARGLLSLVYGVQMMLAYFMMLLVMTYEGGMVLCVISGLAFGHFVFSVLLAPSKKAAGAPGAASKGGDESGGSNSPCCGGNEFEESEDNSGEKLKLINN